MRVGHGYTGCQGSASTRHLPPQASQNDYPFPPALILRNLREQISYGSARRICSSTSEAFFFIWTLLALGSDRWPTWHLSLLTQSGDTAKLACTHRAFIICSGGES